MGLAVAVGVLADLLKNDTEGAEWLQEDLAAANRLLAAEGLPGHDEPTELPQLRSRASLRSFPYSFIHHLRRAYAHRRADAAWVATPAPESQEPSEDPLVQDELAMMTSHLVCHSDAEGFYVPIDFPHILLDEDGELPGGLLGSSQRLLQELVFVAPALGIALSNGELSDEEASRIDALLEEDDEGLYRELTTWLALYEAARLSIAHGTAIVFC